MFETLRRWHPARWFLNALAQTLRNQGIRMWQSHPDRIVEAIAKVEKSWALKRDPDTAVMLGVLYDLANRHQDTLAVHREALHLFPQHARLRHEAGTMLFRHGNHQDAKDFVSTVLEIDPGDVFAQFASTMLANYPAWVDGLAARINGQSQGETVYILACPLWGKSFERDFIRYLCATLLAPNNLPALARRHPVVFAIFTTAEVEERLNAEPLFKRVAEHATIHFVRYGAALVDYARPMVEHYGPEMGPYYARTSKFLLFSCAHYAALAAGHDLDCAVVPLCSDSILSDGVLAGVSEIMNRDIDIVSFWGFRIVAPEAAKLVEHNCRSGDGILAVPAQKLARLFVDYAPDTYCVDSANFSAFPENLFWRVGRNALLVHASHYHPICIRPSALALPLELTIDPVDSRFLDKHFHREDRLHFVRDLSIASLNLEDEAAGGSQPQEPRTMSPRDVGRWLWQVWSPWRERHFRSPICISAGPVPPEWDAVRDRARATMAEVFEVAAALEEGNHRRKSLRARSDLRAG